MLDKQGRVLGSVKWFDAQKGYGFLRTAAERGDVFVHREHLSKAGIERSLHEKEAVVFAYKKGDKGLIVTDIALAEAS